MATPPHTPGHRDHDADETEQAAGDRLRSAQAAERELHRNEQISDPDEADEVDLGSELSFPASDPPAH